MKVFKRPRFALALLAGLSAIAVAGATPSEAAQRAKLTFEPMTPAKPAPKLSAPVTQKPTGLLTGNVPKPGAGLPVAPGTTTPILAPNQKAGPLLNNAPNVRNLARTY